MEYMYLMLVFLKQYFTKNVEIQEKKNRVEGFSSFMVAIFPQSFFLSFPHGIDHRTDRQILRRNQRIGPF